mmetsp:Transcript_65894/g.157533  ORF Transcript_65894/g.157533 Transcript_65894/m.157533 type:complete len:397 (+) Transcript_65894:90-1280(+)
MSIRKVNNGRPATGNAGSAQGGSARQNGAGRGPQKAWWKSFLLFLGSGIAWVISLPLLIIFLTGTFQPHVGVVTALLMAVSMFAVLVIPDDQRISFFFVIVGTLASALSAPTGRGTALVSALLAIVLMTTNGLRTSIGSCPQFTKFQCETYSGYTKRCELQGELDSIEPGRSFFAVHPHGMLSLGWICNMLWNESFHKLACRCYFIIDATLRNKGLLAKTMCDAFEGPHGGLRDTKRSTMLSLMKRGESVSAMVGGFQEATLYRRGRDRVVIKNRKGFVKYCLRYGYRLHPVYTFGESDTYSSLVLPKFLENICLMLNDYCIPTVMFIGLKWMPFLPAPEAELITVVGRPVELPKIEEPSAEEVDHWHAKYIEALVQTFNENKAKVGKPDATLEVL